MEDDTPGKRFHLFELSAQLSVIGDGVFHLDELLCGQRDTNGLLRDFARPLIAGTASFACGAILDRALADIAHLAQAATQTVILALARGG